ncbi:unnamed protein product [Durusdinium trenchii]|uniref:Uncharacterized protein n=1 Tax=Durusdinium trenchii TaxID=1381693 RepID=A0ABP0HVK8_9DINO
MSLLSFFSSQGSAPASAPPAPTETAPVSEGVSGPGGPSGPGGGPCGSMSSAHSGGLDDQDSPQALDQWRMMVLFSDMRTVTPL